MPKINASLLAHFDVHFSFACPLILMMYHTHSVFGCMAVIMMYTLYLDVLCTCICNLDVYMSALAVL